MSMTIKSVILPQTKQLIARVQRAQKVVDSEVLRRCDPLVPFQTGKLKGSGITGTKIGSGKIRYTAPYARRQYYMGRVSATRGRRWFLRMVSQQGNSIRAIAQKALNGGSP